MTTNFPKKNTTSNEKIGLGTIQSTFSFSTMQSDNNDAMTIPSFSSIALSRALSTPPVYRPGYPDEDTLSDADADLSSFLFLFCVFMFIL